MRKTRNLEAEFKIAVDVINLAAMLSCGECTARKIGEDVGARIQIGRRVLYSVAKVQKYVESIAI